MHILNFESNMIGVDPLLVPLGYRSQSKPSSSF